MLTLKIQYSKCAGGKNDDRNNEKRFGKRIDQWIAGKKSKFFFIEEVCELVRIKSVADKEKMR